MGHRRVGWGDQVNMVLEPGSIYPPEPSMPPSWSMLRIFGFEFAWCVAAISGVHPTLFALMLTQGEGKLGLAVYFGRGRARARARARDRGAPP